MLNHAIRHAGVGTADLPSVFSDGFSIVFEHWDDYTNFCQFCNISSEIFNEHARPLSSIKLNEGTVAEPTLMYQVGCGLTSDNFYFYSETDLHDVHVELKRVLMPQRINFDSVSAKMPSNVQEAQKRHKIGLLKME